MNLTFCPFIILLFILVEPRFVTTENHSKIVSLIQTVSQNITLTMDLSFAIRTILKPAVPAHLAVTASRKAAAFWTRLVTPVNDGCKSYADHR